MVPELRPVTKISGEAAWRRREGPGPAVGPWTPGGLGELGEATRAIVTIILMPDESETLRAIIEIVTDQQKLERHQRSKNYSFDTIQDSMVDAYSHIVKVLAPLRKNED